MRWNSSSRHHSFHAATPCFRILSWLSSAMATSTWLQTRTRCILASAPARRLPNRCAQGSGDSRRPVGPRGSARMGAHRFHRRQRLDRGGPRHAVSTATGGSFYVPALSRRQTAEMALAHQVGGKTERAYHRTRQLAKRRVMMEAWGRYCCPDRPAELEGHSLAHGLPSPLAAEAP